MAHARLQIPVPIRRFASVALSSIALLTIAAPYSPASGAVQGWSTYKSVEGRFSVLMPGTPTLDTKSTPTEVGPITMHLASCVASNRFASVIYYDVPATMSKSAAEFLSDTASGFISGGGFVEKASRQQIEIDGHPGIEIIGESADGQTVMQARYYLVRTRVYLVMVGSAAADVAAPDIGNYFSSFQLN